MRHEAKEPFELHGFEMSYALQPGDVRGLETLRVQGSELRAEFGVHCEIQRKHMLYQYSIDFSICFPKRSICFRVYNTNLSCVVPICLSIFLSFSLSIYLSFFLSFVLSFFLKPLLPLRENSSKHHQGSNSSARSSRR